MLTEKNQVPRDEIIDLGETRDVVGFPGYRVGRNGTVWSCRTFRGELGTTWRPRKPYADKDGYLVVTLSVSGVSKTVRLAHLVLEAFVGPRPPGTESCHAPDPSPQNNHVENLRWADHKSNVADKIAMGTVARGEGHGRAKLTEADVLEMRRLRAEEGLTLARIGLRFGVAAGYVASVCDGKNWGHLRKTKPAEPPAPGERRAPQRRSEKRKKPTRGSLRESVVGALRGIGERAPATTDLDGNDVGKVRIWTNEKRGPEVKAALSKAGFSFHADRWGRFVDVVGPAQPIRTADDVASALERAAVKLEDGAQ